MYVFLLISGIVSSVMLRDIMPILQQTQKQSFQFMSSLMDFVFLLGIIGVGMSITVIITTKKLTPLMKRLPIILIVSGVVFLVLQWVQHNYMVGIFNTITSNAPYYGSAEVEFEGKFFAEESKNFLIGIIPSILLIVSGILAFRSYSKPINPIL